MRAQDGKFYRKNFNVESDLPRESGSSKIRLKMDDHWFDHLATVGWDEDDRRYLIHSFAGPDVPAEVVAKPGWQEGDPPFQT